MEGQNTEVIVYTGKEKCSLVYYLSKFLVGLGKEVLLIDNSIMKDLYSLFCFEDEAETSQAVIYRNNITIDKDAIITESWLNHDSAYDYVIIYAGLTNIELEIPIDRLIIGVSYERHETIRIRGFLSENKHKAREIHLCVMDKPNRKFSNKTLLEFLDINTKVYTYEVPYDVHAYASYCSLTQNKDSSSVNFAKAGSSIYRLIDEITDNMFIIDKKEKRRIMG